MKHILTLLILVVGFSLKTLAQTSSTAFNIEELRAAIGSEMENVRVLFVGDDVRKHLDGTAKKHRGWNRMKRKTDVFIVFSEETKKVVEDNVKAKVILGESHATFFTRTWRDYDFLTWINLKGDAVVFVEAGTRGVPQSDKPKPKADTSDAKHINYVWDAIGDKRDFKALIVGSAITKQKLQAADVKQMFSKLPKKADCVVVALEELKLAVSKLTSLSVYVADEPYDQAVNRKGSFQNWVLLENAGQTISRLLATSRAEDIIKPRKKQKKKKHVPAKSDIKLAEFVTGATTKKGKVIALILGSKMTAERLDTLILTEEFKKLDKKLDLVIVDSEAIKKALSKQTSLEIVVASKTYEEFVGSELRVNWMIADAKDSKLGIVRGSYYLKHIVKPRFERGKRPK